MPSDGYDSPSSVDEPLEYITVDTYEWPKSVSPKRSQVDELERRRRHRESQKRFRVRKRQSFQQLRRDAAKLELQLKLLMAIQETAALKSEQRELLAQQQVQSELSPLEFNPTPLTLNSTDDAIDSDALIELLDVEGLLADLDLELSA